MKTIEKFQLLGVSHIVVQPNNIKKSIKFYKKNGFKIEFVVTEKIKKKNFFLYKKKPKIAEAYFLKHKTLKMVDIELISHDILDQKFKNNFELIINSPNNLNKKKILIDPDGNKIIFNKNIKFYQELSFKIFNRLKAMKYLKKNYLNKYNTNNDNNFYFKSYLNEKWSLNLKLKKNKKKQSFYLNNIGLNCISFISIFKKKLKSKNLFSVIKKYKRNKKKKALISFNKSNNFLIEEFFCIHNK